MKTVVNKRFDLGGNELPRLIKTAIFGKFIPIGNLRGGPGARCLAVLSILHYLGYPLYWFVGRYGSKLHFLKRVVDRLRR